MEHIIDKGTLTIILLLRIEGFDEQPNIYYLFFKSCKVVTILLSVLPASNYILRGKPAIVHAAL